MKIFEVASECVPFSKTGGLADVVGALPKALAARGHQVAVLTPRYRGVPASKVFLPSVSVPLDRTLHFPDVQDGGARNGVRHFFLDYPPFFDREGLYTDGVWGYVDNPERYALFCRAALEFLKRFGKPDIIHCHDWQAALAVVLQKTVYAADPLLAGAAAVFTIHNLGYQGQFSADVMTRVGLPADLYRVERLEFYGDVNFLKGAVVLADEVTTVSPRYAEEIQTPEFGHGLDGVMRDRAADLAGILNGVDYSEWSPETDRHIAAHYSASSLDGKLACKKNLLEQFGLPAGDLKTPVIGIVSRFAAQKGFDLIAEDAEAFMENKARLIALGTGEIFYEDLFRSLHERFPEKVGVQIAYDNALAHKIEAGADLFLMPSRYEPCGLNQIYSLKYGTVPVVRATGGLDDTVEAFDPRTGHGTGFKFKNYSGAALLDAVRQALHVYGSMPQAWRKLMQNGMAKDFSWDASAAEYEQLFLRVAKRARTE